MRSLRLKWIHQHVVSWPFYGPFKCRRQKQHQGSQQAVIPDAKHTLAAYVGRRLQRQQQHPRVYHVKIKPPQRKDPRTCIQANLPANNNFLRSGRRGALVYSQKLIEKAVIRAPTTSSHCANYLPLGTRQQSKGNATKPTCTHDVVAATGKSRSMVVVAVAEQHR